MEMACGPAWLMHVITHSLYKYHTCSSIQIMRIWTSCDTIRKFRGHILCFRSFETQITFSNKFSDHRCILLFDPMILFVVPLYSRILLYYMFLPLVFQPLTHGNMRDFANTKKAIYTIIWNHHSHMCCLFFYHQLNR